MPSKVDQITGKKRPRTVPRRPREQSSSDSESENPGIAYRGLLRDEDIYSGLKAKNPNSDITPGGHIGSTRKNTPYISASRSLKPATHFGTTIHGQEGKVPGRIAKINIARLRDSGVPVYDLNNEDLLNELGVNKNKINRYNALKAQEVLIKGNISPNNIEGYFDVNPNISPTEYNNLKENENYNNFSKKFRYHASQEKEPTRYGFGWNSNKVPNMTLPQQERQNWAPYGNPLYATPSFQQPMSGEMQYRKGGHVIKKQKTSKREDLESYFK